MNLSELLREVAPKVLWEFLSPRPKDADYDAARLAARQMALQGFQQVPASLRHPTVQRRLLDWLTRHPDAAEQLRDRVSRSPGRVDGSPAHPDDSDSRVDGSDGRADDPDGYPDDSPDRADGSPDRADGSPSRADEELDRAKRLVKEQAGELGELRERLRASAKENERLKKEERQRETAAAKKLELAQTAAREQLAELRKHDERETRRLHAAERERDELDSTVKVLRKQLRHVNQLLDEQAKKIAALEARLAPKETPLPPASPPNPAPVAPAKPAKPARPSPLDEVFVWMADGHEFRASPREAMRAVDRNDEEFAFRAHLALEGVAPKEAAKKTAFLTRLRGQDSYYVRVLTLPTQRALVDASNVVRATKNRFGKGELRNLVGMRVELRRLGFFPIAFIADASLRYNVDDVNAYNEMVNRGEIEVVLPGTEADEVLVRKARVGGGYVITNDGKFHFKVSPALAPPSIGFHVEMGEVFLNEF